MPDAAAVSSQSEGNWQETEELTHHGCGAEREKERGSLQASSSHWNNTETLQTSCDVNNKGAYIRGHSQLVILLTAANSSPN